MRDIGGFQNLQNAAARRKAVSGRVEMGRRAGSRGAAAVVERAAVDQFEDGPSEIGVPVAVVFFPLTLLFPLEPAPPVIISPFIPSLIQTPAALSSHVLVISCLPHILLA